MCGFQRSFCEIVGCLGIFLNCFKFVADLGIQWKEKYRREEVEFARMHRNGFFQSYTE